MGTTTIVTKKVRSLDGFRHGDGEDVMQPKEREASREVLVESLNGGELKPEIKHAINVALQLLEAQQQRANKETDEDEPRKRERDDDPGPDPGSTIIGAVSSLPPQLIKRAVATLVIALALIQPWMSRLAERTLKDTTPVETKLDEVLVTLAEEKEANVQRDRNMASIAAFVVNSEKARRDDTALPRIPPMLTLMAAQEEVERSTGQ